MAVNTEQQQFSSYTPTTPSVAVPVKDIEAGTTPAPPLPGQFGGHKGSGALAIGDSLFKGILQGHQIKEEKKRAEAQTTIAAADAASQAAYSQYQDALTQANGKTDDPKSQAAYQSYVDIFNKSKEAKAKFVIPEKPAKGEKSKEKKGVKGEAQSGFNNIKEFFAANPHIMPQIALMTMRPNPPGLNQEGQEKNLRMQVQKKSLDSAAEQQDADRRLTYAKQTYALYANLSPEEFDKLDPIAKDQFRVASNVIDEERSGTAKFQTLVDEGGQQHTWRVGDQIPPGWKVYEKPLASSIPRIGTEAAFTDQAYKQYGVTKDTASASLSKYVHDWWSWKAAQGSTSTSASTVDVHGNRTTTNATNRGAREPQPPSGFAPIKDGTQELRGITKPPTQEGAPLSGQPQAGKISAPPTAPKTAAGKILTPPKITLTDAQRTEKISTEQTNRYKAAEADHQKALAANMAAYRKAADTSPEAQKKLQAENDKALENLNKAKGEIDKWYTQQVHSIGGKTAQDAKVPPPEALAGLKPGFVRKFKNGSSWTVDANGNPQQVNQ